MDVGVALPIAKIDEIDGVDIIDTAFDWASEFTSELATLLPALR